MSDVGHNMTEDLLSDLERKINNIYAQAAEEMQEKIKKQLEQYSKKLAIKQTEYANGKISKKEFDTWKQGQAHMQDNTKALADTLTQDLVNHNKIATAIINGHTPKVYALNYNFGTYQIESDIKASTSFSLYNHFTVENLVRDNPQILPEWKIDEKKDYTWNYKKVNSALTQGILQGESIPKIAERFRTGLCAQNKNLMTTFARTATTGAQSSGRTDAYKRAKNMGIDVRQKWLATLDGRTRHTHRLMDGQTINMGEKFDNGCRFPGDPTGPAYEVYNCRCTLVPVIKDFERDDLWKNKIDYEEWEKGGKGFAHWLEEQADPDAAIMAAWSGKKYSFVYNLMKNSTVPGHGADANNFFNALKKLGQDSGIGTPPKVWNAYLTGQLDAEDLKVFEDIIKKYLPKDLQAPAGNPFASKTWSEIITNEPKLLPGQPAMDYLLDNFDTNWSSHLEDWANGKIKDSKLDEFLLGKKPVVKPKLADNAFDISAYKAKLPNKTYLIPDVIDDDDFYNDILNTIEKNKGNDYGNKYWKKYLAGDVDDADLDKLIQIKFAPETLPTDKIAKEAQDSLDKLKLKAGNPMTKEEADTYKVNPLYDIKDKTTTTNCQTSSFAYECRRQGYDVVALPKDEKIDDIFDLQKKLGHDQANGWTNKTTGKPPKALIKQDNPNFIDSKSKMLAELELNVGKNGERYIMGVNWKGSGAHSICVDRDEKGILRIIDNQRGPGEKNTWTAIEYFNEKNVGNIRRLYRVDDCVPNAEYFNKIVVHADKIKINMPAKISDLKPGEYAKVSKAAKAKGETPAVYYKKWKNGIVDDPDLDDIFKAGSKAKTVTPAPKPASAPAAKPIAKTAVSADLDVNAFSKKSASAVWKELNANKAGGGKFWKDITDISKANGVKPAQAWKKYLAGELDADDVKKIEAHLAKIYKKADNIKDATKTAAKTAATKSDELTKIKKGLPNSSATDAINLMDDKHAEYVWDQIEFKSKDLGITMDEYWKKYLAGNISDLDLDAYLKNAIINLPTPKSAPSAAVNAFDKSMVKGKKMSAVYNELKQQGSKIGNDFYYKVLQPIGKPSQVWDKYLKGELTDAQNDLIEDYLKKHYGKKGAAQTAAKAVATKSDDIIKLEKQIDKLDKAINDLEKNPSQYKFAFHGKIQSFDDIAWNLSGTAEEKLQKVIAMGAKPTNTSQKLVDLLDEKQNLKGQILSLQNKAATAAAKSDDLIKAEAKLKKAEEELKKLPNPTYSGIWKDNVTLADYEVKKSTIKAKKIWYEDEIDKLKNDPSYKSWLSDEDKQHKILDLQHHLDDLEDFETEGKKYAKAQKAVAKAQQEVNKFTPSQFAPDAYDNKTKKAAKSFTDRNDADKYHRSYLDSIWENLSDEEKYGIWEYTRNSNPMNKSLSGYHDSWSRSSFLGYANTDWGHEDNWRTLPSSGDFTAKKFGKNGHVNYHKAITDATKGIQKSSLPQNTVLVRGSDNGGLAGMIEGKGFLSFNDAKKLLDSGNINDIKAALEGQVIKNHAFTSTGIAKGTGFGGEVKFEIYAPKGTHAIYAEPQSHFGNTSPNALYRVGKSYSSVGGEAEVILQRGTEFRITNVKKSGSTLTVKMEIVKQPDYFKFGDEDTFNDGITRHKK